MRRVHASVDGVRDVCQNWFNDDRFPFMFRDRPCVVHEPFGDNGRYWIGPIEFAPALDMRPIHDAFQRYRFILTFDRDFRK